MPDSAIMHRPGHLVAEGFYFGVDQVTLKANFDPAFPYSYCRICGWLYQPPSQRHTVPPKLQLKDAPNDSAKKRANRAKACDRHAFQHSDAEKKSVGDFSFLPEATSRLAAFGIAPLAQIAHDIAHRQAANEAARFDELDQFNVDDPNGRMEGKVYVPASITEGHIKNQHKRTTATTMSPLGPV
jgi:hypothetical protein